MLLMALLRLSVTAAAELREMVAAVIIPPLCDAPAGIASVTLGALISPATKSVDFVSNVTLFVPVILPSIVIALVPAAVVIVTSSACTPAVFPMTASPGTTRRYPVLFMKEPSIPTLELVVTVSFDGLKIFKVPDAALPPPIA